MGKLFNRAKMTVSGTPGTGTITLLAAAAGFQTFASAGVANGDVISYVIEDGTNWEYGQGTYTSAGTTLARTTVQGSSNAGSAISATSSALVFASALAADIVTPTTGTADGAWTTYTPTVTSTGTLPTTADASACKWKKIGTKTYLLRIKWNVTTVGPGTSGFVSFTLPDSSTATDSFPCSTYDGALGQAMLGGSISSGTATMNLTMAAHTFYLSGFYEAS